MSTKQLRNYTYSLVELYATYNRLDDFYSLNLNDLPDFTQHEFAGLIMAEDNTYASEATGPDNPLWNTKMLPALLRYLQNSTDKDEFIEFNKAWLGSITSYLDKHMQELINDALAEFNAVYGHTQTMQQIYGVRPCA